ncbi:MAG: FkbM family methyltransferase [Reyranella sp.]|uniref:FkbM family methyltransferase n=1 Tax=Reyranella sp. TaxID=1929291 RepID=UPI003D0D5FC1
MTESAASTADAPLYQKDHLRLRQCRHGMMLYNINDRFIGAMLDRYGEFSEEENEIFRQIVKPGMTVVEAGANIGVHTLAIAQGVGPSGRVLAFEPQRSVFQILCANLALNGLEQVEPHWAAMGNVDGVIAVPRLDSARQQNFGGLALDRQQTGDSVRLVRVDSLGLPACHLVKVDVEGMELDVLRGAADTIRRCVPLIYTENDRQDRSPALIGQLQALGYRCFWHLPRCIRMPNFRGNTENTFPPLMSSNMLCVPASRDITVNGLREVLGPQDWWR